nr:uncharacterized protein LOC120962006 [Aegilops tauschii subsp. strangulata]
MEGVQKTLEELLTKFSSLSTEVQQLSTQVADFGKGLDAVKRTQAMEAAVRTAPSSSTTHPAAVLVNKGPPLLHVPPRPPPPPVRRDAHPDRQASPPRSPRDTYRHKPPKHDFPRFSGDAPRLWFDLCHTYFQLYQTPPEHWVSTAVLYMDGHAALWCQAYKRLHGLGDWFSFMEAVQTEFGQDEFDGLLHRLHHLKQTSTVAEYRLSFEAIMYHLIALDPSLNQKFFVSQFIIGLRDEQAAGSPTGVYSRHPSAAGACNGSWTSTATHRWCQKRGPDDFGRERQLREFRRANGLCFKCGDKYSREHKCNRVGQLLTIEVGDHGELLSDDAIRALELLDDNPEEAAACYQISVHAVAGTESSGTMRLRALVGNQVMLLLVDSGSTHTFVNSTFASRAGCTVQEAEPVTVRVANGETLKSTQQVSQLKWWCQGHTFSTDMRLLDLGAYDAVLGVDWLAQFSPMNCHWGLKTMEFRYGLTNIQLQGVRAPGEPTLTEIRAEQLSKWIQGNEVWALAVIQPADSVTNNTKPLPLPLQALLEEFADVFQEPTTLPPHRSFDHAIHLEPGATPPNVRPYRYSPLQKDEIERQVTEMLKAGLITNSISPFVAPVLLVKKKDDTWRFCVDYRRLNDITIKNKFPLPVIDELLDELAGARFFSKLDLRSGYHQIRMRPEDEAKTAFKTHHGHFQFRVMPFGVTNGPPTFQCLMNSVLAPGTRKYVIAFLDDILTYSESFDEHLQHLRLVLTTLRQHQLYAKFSKCTFAQSSINYLGHVISAEGVATESDKTEAIQNWPQPSSQTELRAFLGLTGYYRKFVRNYSIITKPLTTLLSKKGFVWSVEATEAFLKLKQVMTTTPVLALPNFSLPFTVETDACDTGIGAVLSQQGHPIAFLSRALGVNNKKLSVYEKEFLAVMMAIDRWRPYLQRGQFTILTDHKSLCTLGEQHLGSELQRKAMAKLGGLQFKFKYRKGIDNTAADSLSRVGQPHQRVSLHGFRKCAILTALTPRQRSFCRH